MAAPQPFKLALHHGENVLAGETIDTWLKTAERIPTIPIIPPGLDATTWEQALVSFREILGDDGVLTSHEHRVRYADPYAECQDETEQQKRGTAATLYPITVEHIQAVLKICHHHGIPLWTVSRGKNLGYGGPAARVKVPHTHVHVPDIHWKGF
jgi:hypothetical protein